MTRQTSPDGLLHGKAYARKHVAFEMMYRCMLYNTLYKTFII